MGLMAPGLAAAQTSSSNSGSSATQPSPAISPDSGGTANSSQSQMTNTTPNQFAQLPQKKTVLALQQALKSDGENVRNDGVWGPATQTALKHYQQKNGIPVTGELDQATRTKLNLQS